MSVIVKNMEMPERCGQCFLRVGNCKQRIYMEQRPKGCPLVEIPTPHGRLIDADEIVMPCLETTADQKWMEIAIKSTPTVIEAEGEKDGRKIHTKSRNRGHGRGNGAG